MTPVPFDDGQAWMYVGSGVLGRSAGSGQACRHLGQVGISTAIEFGKRCLMMKLSNTPGPRQAALRERVSTISARPLGLHEGAIGFGAPTIVTHAGQR
jgi:hypothetical protein